MKFQTITIAQLPSYLQSDDYRRSKHIAISKQRALSHGRNPRAREDDVVLVLVYETTGAEDELVAYLGVFADDLQFKTGVRHVGWLSCMWVNPKMRGKGIAKRLLQTVFEAWEYRILVTEFTPAAKGLYDRSECFLDLARPKGVRGYLRPNVTTLLTKKNPKWNKWRPFLRCIDGLLTIPNTLRLAAWRGTKWATNGYSIEYLSELDAEAGAFVEAQQSGELIQRGVAELNWLLRNPWLLQAPLKDRNAQRYHFSSVAKQVGFLCIKVYNQRLEMVALAILSTRDGAAKLPYVYCLEGEEEQLWQIIDAHLLSMKIATCTIFHPRMVAALEKRRSPFLKLRSFQRHYIIGTVLATDLAATGAFILQDGDADAAFT